MYDDTDRPIAMPAGPEPDPRILAMHKVVEAEQTAHNAAREADRRAKQAAIAAEELRTAREELHNLLGFAGVEGMKTPAEQGLRR